MEYTQSRFSALITYRMEFGNRFLLLLSSCFAPVIRFLLAILERYVSGVGGMYGVEDTLLATWSSFCRLAILVVGRCRLMPRIVLGLLRQLAKALISPSVNPPTNVTANAVVVATFSMVAAVITALKATPLNPRT